jgi:Ni,Fe-hydrogenase I large subunit
VSRADDLERQPARQRRESRSVRSVAAANPVADANHPLEVIRTMHSFDPCMSCAVHAFDPDGNEINTVKVL